MSTQTKEIAARTSFRAITMEEIELVKYHARAARAAQMHRHFSAVRSALSDVLHGASTLFANMLGHHPKHG